MKEYHWQIEMYKGGTWVTEIRVYYAIKQVTDFDLHDVPGLRRNAMLIVGAAKAVRYKPCLFSWY